MGYGDASDYMLPPTGRLPMNSSLDGQLRGMRPKGYPGSTNFNVQSGPLGLSESADTGYGGQLTAINSYGGLGQMPSVDKEQYK